MPHKAMVMMSAANAVSDDPSYLAARSEALDAATTLAALADALELHEGAHNAAEAVDGFLPPAIVQTIVAAYRGAAATGVDGVYASWFESGGFLATVGQASGTDIKSDRGVVALTVHTPRQPPSKTPG